MLVTITSVSAINISNDDFESNNFCGGSGWINTCWTTTGATNVIPNNPHQATYSGYLNGASSIERSVDTSSYNNNKLGFWLYVISPTHTVSYIENNSKTTLQNFTSSNGGYNYYEYAVPKTSNLTIIFENTFSSQVYIDEIYVNGSVVACAENWSPQYNNLTSCQTNNTISQLKTYVDTNTCGTTNDLPVDNGSITEVYCNYCDPDWQDVGEDCQANSTRYVEYLDLNGCYSQTGLLEDSPPIDDQTVVSCEYYTQDFNCSISNEPYLTKKIDYTCNVPNNMYCVNKVTYGLDDVLQVNPQRIERTAGGLVQFKDDLESRDYFTVNNGLLNAYYTNKNLAGDTPFILTTTCSDGNNTIVNQQIITPSLRELKNTAPALIWIKDNASYLFASILVLFLIAFLIGAWIKTVKRQ